MSMKVETANEWLASVRKPTLQNADTLSLDSDDCLVMCAGFEDRATAAVLRSITTSRPYNLLLIGYVPKMQQNKDEKVRKICRAHGIKVAHLAYNRKDPSGFGNLLSYHLLSRKGRVFVDISGMSRLLIVQTLVAIGSLEGGLSSCFVIYSEAKVYPPSQRQMRKELSVSSKFPTRTMPFLSSGIFDITVVPELSSCAPATEQTHLVVFPSVDAHHLSALRTEIQPTRYTFIEGVPPNPASRWRTQLISELNSINQIENRETYHASTLDYRETMDILLDVYSRSSLQERIIIAPTGSKMQTVAVAIFRLFLRDIQIVYPTPARFENPDHYTMGVGPTHLLPLVDFTVGSNR